MAQKKPKDRYKWKRATETAKRIGGRKKNDFDFIWKIYKRIGGR